MLCDLKDIEKYLLPCDKIHLFDMNDIGNKTKEEAIRFGEKYLNYEWKPLVASLYMEFFLNGNRTNYEDVNFEKRRALNCLIIAEVAENKGRFLKDIIDGIWSICEETTWVLPAHNGGNPLFDITKPNIDLFSAQTAAQLALCIYLLRDSLNKVSEQIVKRVEYELTNRIIDPFLKYNYWWMGYGKDKRQRPSNWTTWCNSTCLTVCIVVLSNKEKKISFINKACEILDYYIQNYPEDGGCDEGANYWYMSAGCMFDCLELLYKATDGYINIFANPKVRLMGSYIYKMHIADKYFVNFADCSAIADKGDARTFLFGKRCNDSILQAFGKEDYETLEYKLLPQSMNLLHKLMAYSLENEIMQYKGEYKTSGDIYIESLQMLISKKENFSLAVKGGNNADNHNHNDVGSFIVYSNSKPLIIDVGVESYTKTTFSKDRYTIWTMQSSYHNLPQINGYMQCDGEAYKATNVIKTDGGLSFDIESAYPKEANVKRWNRTVCIENDKIILTDEFDMNKPTSDIQFNFMTAEKPVEENGTIKIACNIIKVSQEMHIEIEQIDIPYDAKLTPVWGDKVYRIKYSLLKEEKNNKIIWTIS